ncbi:MAG TPA: OsmC family protein [Flavisolibacter sp.]|jgi:uncharacterized OsmC-like protein|nr:OsmC family protein [Flavisolibacter sp.]
MTSTVVYEKDLRVTCTHLQSSSQVETDAPVDNNGKGERFSPTDLLATSLATCMVTIMGIKARSMGLQMDDTKIEVEKIMLSDPRRVGEINLTIHIPQALQQIDEKGKQVLKNAALTCPVIKSIHPDIKVDIDWGSWS